MDGRMSFSLLFDDQRKNHVNGRAFPGSTVNAELALQLADPFAHSGNSDAEERISAIVVRRRGHSNAVVADGEADMRRRAINENLHGTRLRVAMHVGQGFLRNAEQGEL